VFLSPDETLMIASIRLDSETVTVDGMKPLFKVRLRPQVGLDACPYDMTPDARRFLVNSFVEEPNASSPVTLVIHWPELLKKYRGTRDAPQSEPSRAGVRISRSVASPPTFPERKI
jgi:hypothetical protein